MDGIDPLSADFEVMCFVKDKRAVSGTCTFDELAGKFGKDVVQKLLENGFLRKTGYAMIDWTYRGQVAMGPDAINRHITKQVLREKGILNNKNTN